jgi:SNF2 family DNA or RNA helicase
LEWVELSAGDHAEYAAAERDGDLMTLRHAASVGEGGTGSAKMQRLAELLESYREIGCKVVVFSFFRQTLDLVSEIAGGCHMIHGGVPTHDRQSVVDQFCKSYGFAVLASQVDAGGVGLNLQAAQVVVLMEPQLKPSTESQAIARVHRMGQVRSVMVHRLVARGTVEEWALELLQEKSKVFSDYADQSALKEASAMATDFQQSSIERELVARISHNRRGTAVSSDMRRVFAQDG